MRIPKSHPRYQSLLRRRRLAKGCEEGLVVLEGLIAHGRGEAFDYLLGEKTIPQAELAEKVATAYLLRSKNPILSINGNTAVLAGKEMVKLSKAIPAKIEVNLFHRTQKRMRKVISHLEKMGGRNVLGLKPDARIPGLDHPRSLCTKKGIYSSDVVLVPLEDGDRTKALVEMGKVVIAIDLNPLSRTSEVASVTVVDEVSRAIPRITAFAKELKRSKEEIDRLIADFDNNSNLEAVLSYIRQRLREIT